MSRTTAVYFDPELPLVEIISALYPAGMTLKGDGNGNIMAVRREGWDKRKPKLEDSNVIQLRSQS